eukprot:TCALIF_06026-PA protein Name:"Similar to SMYD4 SET and MYND domain-containing protein 4 (Pongo abelii)" AED:0.08 eAED:0.08 QI:8/0.66/0.25/1/0.33/0.5/4/0/663
MEMTQDVKKQLMALAGMTDESEFEKFVKDMVPEAENTIKQQNRHSPFQLHYIKMLTTIESKGLDEFARWNGDIEKQLQYTFNEINALEEFVDPRNFLKKQESPSETLTTECKSLRDAGNKHYQKKVLDLALQAYSESIMSAPLDDKGKGRDAALGLGNRSAVYFELKEYNQCLDDIAAAFIFGYPIELAYKLWDRQGKCLEAQGFLRDAAKAFKACEESLPQSNLKPSKREELAANIKLTMNSLDLDQCKGIYDPNIVKDIPCPFKIWEAHPKFPHFSDSLNIVFNESQGRHVLATKNIEVGEPVVIEEPISFHLSPFKMATNCSHCFRACGNSVLPSPLLKKAKFCGFRCWKLAMNSYHPVEARFDITEVFYGDDPNSQLSGCLSLAYRAISQKKLAFFLDNKEKLFTTHDKLYGTNPPPGFSYEKDEHYRGLFNLVTHYDQMQIKDRVTIMIRSVVLLKCLKAGGYFGGEPTTQLQLSPDELFIGKLLFHFQCGIQYNLHTIYQVNGVMEPSKRIPLQDIGSGVYPTTLFFNHSCAPNTIRVNQGPRVIIITKSFVKAGEEVTDCYGIHHMSIPRAERQETLRRGYAFECQCQACKKDYPLLASLPNHLTPQVALKLGNTLGKYQKLFHDGKYGKALNICQEYIRKLEHLGVPLPHRNYEI